MATSVVCARSERKGLRDVSPDGETQQIDLRKSEGADEIGAVVGHRIDRVRGLSGRRGDPRIVEQDDGPMFRKSVGDRGIPVIHSATKMLHDEERHAAGLAESALGEADAVGLDELCRRGLVAVLVHRDSLSRWLLKLTCETVEAGSFRAWT